VAVALVGECSIPLV
jgi:hypothetical protein